MVYYSQPMYKPRELYIVVQPSRFKHRPILRFAKCYCSEWDTDGHSDFSGFLSELKEVEGSDGMIDGVILEEMDHSSSR